ncbi:hypothetical protein HDF26_002289 [Pedobacter cryoconitis]|uniref:hypothetical protein n=1 Tax=Pedobacter cryoconitis TaxID=188932 RepID=UPI00160AD99F|nr:hypothetical protein [Pedobacter cryoconitis]MBB6271832.1 hypothetical protein [Pedobacter cryoconitis]
MKVSKQPTGYLMLKAKSNSEWDSCDFVIVEASKSWQNLMSKRLVLLQDFRNDAYFYSHAYWDAPSGYFIHGFEQQDSISFFLADQQCDWCFVELSGDELDALTAPENKLDAHQMCITGSGSMHYKAYGKYTGESFWTESIDIPSVLEKLKT